MIDRAGRCALGRTAGLSLLLALASFPTVSIGQLPGEVPSLAPMIERVSPAVVNISVSGRPYSEDPFFRRMFPEGGESPIRGSGSGVIVDAENGYVLTNHHVVADAERIIVTLFDNRSMDAEVIGTDEQTDIAVLRVEADGLAQIEFGDSDGVRVGDFVVAIGNPFGLSHTVTSGIVSGLGRSNISPDRQAYEDFIQTDASINPGNSGGALVGLDGELLGVNSAILSRNGGNIGIGFAIPVNMARYVMGELIESGSVSRGALGVSISSITADDAMDYGLEQTRGAVVRAVAPGSAAAEAGLQIDDVIVSVDGGPVRDAGALRAAIGLLHPGTTVEIGLIREGQRVSVEATLGDVEQATRALLTGTVPSDAPVFEGVELLPDGGRSDTAGLLVAGVESTSLAARRGLRRGDVITHVNQQRVATADEAAAIAENAESVVLDVRRGARAVSIVMR